MFTVASAVVAFEVWPSDPSSVELSSLTVAPPQSRHAASPSTPLVLPGPTRAQARTGRAPTRSAVVIAPSTRPQRRPAHPATGVAGGTTSYDSGAPSTGEISGRPGSDTPAPVPPAATEGPLAKVGATVDKTTRSLGRTLSATTDSLGKHLGPLSPTLGKTVAKAGASLAETVQDLGAVVAALLGHVSHGPNLPPSP